MTYSDDDPWSDDPPPEEPPPPPPDCDVCGFLRAIYDNSINQSIALGRIESKLQVLEQALDTHLRPQFDWNFGIKEKCDSTNIKTYTGSGRGLPAMGLMVAHISRMLGDLQTSSCENDNYAAIPEWWQLRPEANRPQLIVQCAEKNADGSLGSAKYVVTIPHYRYSTLYTVAPFNWLEKGSIQGILTLKDNSKVIIYGANLQHVRNRLAQIWNNLDLDYRLDFNPKVGPSGVEGFKTITVYPKYGKYFSTGARKTVPDWVVRYEVN